MESVISLSKNYICYTILNYKIFGRVPKCYSKRIYNVFWNVRTYNNAFRNYVKKFLKTESKEFFLEFIFTHRVIEWVTQTEMECSMYYIIMTFF